MATPKQVQRRGRLSLILGTVFAALMFAAVAYADEVIPDGDTVAVGNQPSLNLGSVSPGQILTPQTSFELVCTGKEHPDLGQTLNLNFSLAGSTVPAGGSLSATNASIGSISASWPDDASGGGSTNCPSPAPVLNDNGNSTVTITAPNTPGGYSFVVRWNFGFSTSGSGDPQAVIGSGTSETYTLTVAAPVNPDADGDGVPDSTDNCDNAATPVKRTQTATPWATPVTEFVRPGCRHRSDRRQRERGFPFHRVRLLHRRGWKQLDHDRTPQRRRISDRNGNGTWSWSHTANDNGSGTVVVQAAMESTPRTGFIRLVCGKRRSDWHLQCARSKRERRFFVRPVDERRD